jgi:hypothetical protein
MRIPTWAIPDQVMTEYKLQGLVHKDHVLVEIRKGMYGLPQAGSLAIERLVAHLAKYGYTPCRHTTAGLWSHATKPLRFSLVVDDFGVQYVGCKHTDHLLLVLRDLYACTVDWNGTKYIGLTLNWDYAARTVDLSMPGYIRDALHCFQHPNPLTLNTRHMPGYDLLSVPPSNSHPSMIPHTRYMPHKSSAFNKSSAHSSFMMREPLIQQCWLRWACWQLHNSKVPKPLQTHSHASSITLQHILMHRFDTRPVT